MIPGFLEAPPRNLFFTGKGGVGKTSVACASAVQLAGAGRRVLLISTDPASNLDEVLEVGLAMAPRPVPGVSGLDALNVDPHQAAAEFRENVVAPYRNLLPESAIRSIEEQLSGACTVEIAAFDAFSRLLGDDRATADYDHVIFDTAPTGHTLRLLALPSAWDEFLATNMTGTTCIGPLSSLKDKKALYEASVAALRDGMRTLLVLVTRPEPSSLNEAARTADELQTLGIANQHLVVNGVFTPADDTDAIARQMAGRATRALAAMPGNLAGLSGECIPLRARAPMGVEGLRQFFQAEARPASAENSGTQAGFPDLGSLVEQLSAQGHGVVLTAGKGGVGKTSVAAEVAAALAERGHRVHLTTTDPAAHVEAAIGARRERLTVDRVDPVEEVARYREEVMATAGAALDEQGRAFLEEDLRSPCTEEIAVFRAFARQVAKGREGFVIIDTAPTGHTLLLLDAAQAYHREVERSLAEMPEEVKTLLPRLRDPDYTRVLIVTLPEATPVHEAARLQEDLQRAGIAPFAWVVNQSLAPLDLSDPVLQSRQGAETRYLKEVKELSRRVCLIPWGKND
jgi:arsenite-transporting ATPase